MKTISFALVTGAVLALGAVIYRQTDLQRQLQALEQTQIARRENATERGREELNAVRKEIKSLRDDLSRSRAGATTPSFPPNSALARLDTLERQLKELATQLEAMRQGYTDLASRVPPPNPSDLAARKGRGWGPEQAAGPPDTDRSGDIQTAWPPREPDGGEEWLKLDYTNAVDISEIRILETDNPGAITKVTAVLPNGQEQVIWEGTMDPASGAVETVIPASAGVRANSVKVYLDTRRVPGWNEIDAVQLVGRDGSRQWASGASASSTFAEGKGNARVFEGEGHRLAE